MYNINFDIIINSWDILAVEKNKAFNFFKLKFGLKYFSRILFSDRVKK